MTNKSKTTTIIILLSVLSLCKASGWDYQEGGHNWDDHGECGTNDNE